MPFRTGTAPGYKTRVTHGTRTMICGCDTQSYETACLMEGWVKQMRADRKWKVIDGILDKTFTLPDVYDNRDRLDDFLAEQGDLDLSPLVAKWNGKGKHARSAKYVTQVRCLIPEGQKFPRSKFRRRTIAEFLEGLDVSDPTRNRYKAALSQFATWLVRHEYLETNPVRDAGSFAARPPRMVHLSPKQAKGLVDALAGEARFVAALMAGTGVEWQAVERGRVADIDSRARTFHAHGGKTQWRDRVVEITEDWTWPAIRAHLRTRTPNAPLVTRKEYDILAEQREACEALGLPRHTLHDWRHTYAVTALQRGDDPQAVKRQLGHAPHSVLLFTTYGVYINAAKGRTPKRARSAGRSATNSASTRGK